MRFSEDPDAGAEPYCVGDEWVSRRLGIPISEGSFPGRIPCYSGLGRGPDLVDG